MIPALTYAYDTAGRRTQVAGSYARSNLPTALASATYNANNQLANWGGATLTYDNNGNLLTNGTNTHTWNARDQLASISGGVAASFGYDAFNRRRTKTIAAVTTDFLYDGLTSCRRRTVGPSWASPGIPGEAQGWLQHQRIARNERNRFVANGLDFR